MHAGGEGSLRATYVERWSGVQLWIYRTRTGRMPFSIIRRGSDNNRRIDAQLSRGEAPCPPGSWVSRSLPHALLAALVVAYGPEFVTTSLDEVRQELASAPPGGPRGGYATAPLTGPLP